MMVRLALLLTVVIVQLAAAPNLHAARTPFGKWKLRQMHENGMKVALVAGSEITLRIRRTDRCSGNASVNNYFGDCKIAERNRRIRFPGNFATTLILGPPDLMEQEGKYLNILNAMKRFRVLNGRRLRLKSNDGMNKLVFKRNR